LVVSDTVVVVNGLDVTYATRDGKTIENPGRFTFVVARRGADWQIVHFHRSGVPGGGRGAAAAVPAGR
ncbi:MAG TPA: nuclear transport factor 2 family protein, partial [Vicinamibacterales bacterium]